MRILHVTHGPALGGAERSLIELARAQRAEDHEVHVGVGVRGPVTDALDAAGLAWWHLRWSPAISNATAQRSIGRVTLTLPHLVAAAVRLDRVISRLRPDVVHVHTRKSQVISAIGSQDPRVRLLWHLRDDLPSSQALRFAVRLAMRRVDHAVTLSQWMVDRYRAAGALPRSGRIGLVPSGVDPTQLATLDTPFLDGRKPPVVGFVGQIARWKAPHLLVDAAERLEDLSEVQFRIVGEVMFPAAEAAYGRWLRARIAGSPAVTRIRWEGPAQGPEDAFDGIDILVHTSTAPEPFGRVLVEAMASRRPIVALPIGAPAELLDATCAVFASAPDGSSVAQAIRRLVKDRAFAARLASAALGRAQLYSPDAVSGLMEAEYRWLDRGPNT